MRTLLIVGIVAVLFQAEASAQANFSAQRRVTSLSTFGGRSSSASILSRPTVSPYLALTDVTGTGQDMAGNYFTQVRPRLERQQQQQAQQLQIQSIQRDMTAMRSQAARQSGNGARMTGHPTRFGYYLQYYPGLNRR